MNALSTSNLAISLVILILMSAFFSASETSITSINKYKLQHKASKKNPCAILLIKLLKRPDTILSTILIGNTFCNILASTIATILAIRISPEYGIIVIPFILTFTVLIFAEIAPKTFAALYPEKIAYPASKILYVLMKILYVVVFFTTKSSNFLLKLFRIHTNKSVFDPLTNDELKGMLKSNVNSNNNMLVGVLNLEEIIVNDIMIPRKEIIGIDINGNWRDIMNTLKKSDSPQLIVYKSTIDKSLGIIYMKTIVSLLEKGSLTKNTITRNLKSIKYIPEGTTLKTQLKNFQKHNFHLGIVVD